MYVRTYVHSRRGGEEGVLQRMSHNYCSEHRGNLVKEWRAC